ncbi:MAG: UpxY family transcription antiterminator [Bacteroidales bacterium]|nr:UpxY family transcription antiterminator [Bacteroidales bacterium]
MIQPACWYVAHTRYFRWEIKVRDLLTGLGVENFVPTVRRKKTRGGGTHECAVVPNLVFLKATKREATDLVNRSYVPMSFLIDHATHSIMTVDDKEMEDFQRVFQTSIQEGGLMDKPLRVGDRVRVIKGPLQGVEGNVLELQGKLYVVVSLAGLVFAKARVPRAWLEKVNSES